MTCVCALGAPSHAGAADDRPGPRRLELSDQVLTIERVYEADFSVDRGEFVLEGGSELTYRDNRLWWDVRKTRTKHHYATVWCVREFSGDSVIEYAVRPEVVEKNSNNMNFIAYATHLDGGSVLRDSASRTGEYPEYHVFNNYLFTYLGKSRIRARLRRNPGFELLAEKRFARAMEPGRDYRYTMTFQGHRLRVYVDGEKVFDYTDPEPFRRGRHAFRTYNSALSASYFRVSRLAGSD